MYKVILVDDEIEVRNRLRHLMVNSTWKFDIIAEYSNGYDAYEGIIANNPDLVITDIKLPYMDGLEVIRRVNETNPLIKSIVITGFDEFDYAKKAANLNVLGLISKPITQPEIDNILARATTALDDERQLANNMDRLQNYYDSSLQLIRDNMLGQLVSDNNPSQSIYKLLSLDNVHFDYQYIRCIVFDYDNLIDSIAPEMYERSLVLLRKYAKESLATIADCDVFLRASTVIAFVKSDTHLAVSDVEGHVNAVVAQINRMDGISISAGISKTDCPPHNLRHLYTEARKTLELRMTMGGGKIYYAQDNCTHSRLEVMLVEDSYCRQLTNYLRSADKERFCALLDGLEYVVTLEDNKSALGYNITNILNAILKACVDISTLSAQYEDFDNIYSKLTRYKLAEQAFEQLRQLAYKVIQVNDSVLHKDMSDTTRKILHTIQKNYADETYCLESLSKQVCLSVSYISSILKEQNTTFVKYLTTIRIDKAKQLLIEPDSKIVSVATAVGYRDAYYFSHCFKKHSGISPKEYREANVT